MVAALVACVLGGALQVDGSLGAPSAAAYAVAVVSAGALPLRHRAPLAVLTVTVGCGVLVAPLGLWVTPVIVAPALVAAYAFAERAERRAAALALLPAAALLVAFAPVFEEEFSWEDVSRLVSVVVTLLMAGVLGQSVQNRRAYLAAVEERAQRAEATRDSEARQRVEEERVRIARELHDLVAHQVTLAHAQAMVATRLFDSRREDARASLHDVVATTSHALDDLRATVGLLRQPEDADGPDEPAPGLARLPALVESFRRAGLEVVVQEDGAPRPLPPGLDLTAYRIVQEALTNVSKHAGTGAARVGLSWQRDLLLVTVADDGRGVGAAAGGSTGFGLIGMRERATAVGGRLTAGRRPDGGFLVSTELPLPSRKAGA